MARKLYPAARGVGVGGGDEEGNGDRVVEGGAGRVLERARKASRMKEEKEVKEPQKPVVRPM